MSKAKESVQRFLKSIDKGGRVEWARKTQFMPQPDGSLRRLVTRKDGTIEKDEIFPAGPLQERPRRSSALPQSTLKY